MTFTCTLTAFTGHGVLAVNFGTGVDEGIFIDETVKNERFGLLTFPHSCSLTVCSELNISDVEKS